MIASLLEEVCIALNGTNIPYMVSGSMAMTLYTIPRMTRDIDIIVELNKEDIDKFYDIFAGHAYIDKLTVEEEVKRRGMFNVIDHRTGYKVDFMLKKFNEYRGKEFDRRQFTTAFGFPMWVVSLEDLILSKIIWIQEYQSERQMEDIKNLLRNDKADMAYIQEWCQKLGLNTFNLL
jgi:predicted nucleotidyltransferase component of viral defense system